MAGINTLDWRRRTRVSSHTREVRADHLPAEMVAAMAAVAKRVEEIEKAFVAQAEIMSQATIRAIETERRLATIEAAMAALAAEAAKRVRAA